MIHLGEHSQASTTREIIFTVTPGPDAPRVYDCAVAWRHNLRWDGRESWRHAARFCVNDPLGPDNIEMIEIVDPTGRVYQSRSEALSVMWEDERGRCVEWKEDLAGPPRFSGTYTFIASNRQGKSSAPQYATTASFTDEFLPQITYPPSSAVIRETVPTFRWEPIARPGWLNRIRVSEVISEREEVVWEVEEPFGKGVAKLSLRYNSDGTASQPELIPGHTYVLGLQVHHYFPEGGGVETWRSARFTIAPLED